MRAPATILLVSALLILPACVGGLESFDDYAAQVQAERELIAQDLAAAQDKLAAAQAELPDSELVAEAAEAVDAAEGGLATVDAVVAAVLEQLAAREAQADATADTIDAAATTAATVAPFLPPPFDGILALAGVVGGTVATALSRRQVKRTAADRDLKAEALRDLARGIDTLRDNDAVDRIRGKLSERTRPEVARAADHPLGAEA